MRLLEVIAAPLRFVFPGLAFPERRSYVSRRNLRRVLKERNAAMPKTLSPDRKELNIVYDLAKSASSPFLTKLPLELRQQVYNHALGGHVVHIFLIPARVAHICCTYHADTDFRRNCCLSARYSIVPMSIPIPPSDINVALLLTCRQVYTEALSTLYSSNTFDIDDLSAFNLLATNIPPKGLSAIKSLHVNWYTESPPFQNPITAGKELAPYDHATYLRFWRTLAHKMPALKELRLAISDMGWMRKLELEDPWVQPIKEVKGLQVFESEIVEPNRYRGSHFWEKEQMVNFTNFTARLKNVICRERVRFQEG